MGKYKMINGVLVDTTKTKTEVNSPMTIVTTPDELAELSQEYGSAMYIPTATVVALEQYTDNETFTDKFHRPGLDHEQMLDHLSSLFARYEVPIGLLSKLCELSNYNISIVIDDSGSMNEKTDSKKLDVYTEYMKQHFKRMGTETGSMTRWEEEEDRLHLMIDFLAYIPTGPIKIVCMNRPIESILIRNNKTPEQFLSEGHECIRKMFMAPPSGGTPTMTVMKRALSSVSGPTCHYLFTDGVPSDCSTHDLGTFLAKRPDAHQNPLTFVSCTDVDSECQWMKEIEEVGPYMAEVDDYESELKEVRHDQGPTFPYSKGLWIICLLVGAINPYDLDAMDDSTPFTKYTLENIMGRSISSKEYEKYWFEHPQSKTYKSDTYSRFSTEQKHAAELVTKPKSALSSFSKFLKNF